MNTNRVQKGGDLIEYAIPLALIAIVVGMSLFYMSTNGSFFKNIIFSSSGSVDETGGRIAFGSGTTTGGVFTDTAGKVYLSNHNGQTIRIPLVYYEKNKDGMEKYLSSGKFDFNSNLGVETSGSVGIEDIAYTSNASTLLYSALIDLAKR